MSNCQDIYFHMAPLPNQRNLAPNESEDVKIDITEYGKSDVKLPIKTECGDTTEQSSSFGNTDSGIGSGSSSSDDEVDSKEHDDGTAMMALDEYGDLFTKRKKKLTPQWRKFIRPLMWRCKWLELRMKELQSQALKYDKELAECNKKKQLKMEEISSEDLAVKSLPYLPKNHQVNVMRRKKRKRIEEVTDVVSYMTHHNLFSYYANKKRFPDFAYIDDDDYGKSVMPFDKHKSGNDEIISNDELPSPKFVDGNSVDDLRRVIEAATSRAGLFRVVEAATARVGNLDVRVEKVSPHNGGEFASSNDTRFPARYAPTKSVFTLVHGGRGRIPVGDLILPGSIVTSHGKVTPLPDMIESTDHPQAGPSRVKIESDIQIPKKMEEDSHDSEVMAGANGSSHMAIEVQEGVKNIRNEVTGSPENTKMLQEQSSMKTRTKKRKGRRRTGSIRRRSIGLSMLQK